MWSHTFSPKPGIFADLCKTLSTKTAQKSHFYKKTMKVNLCIKFQVQPTYIEIHKNLESRIILNTHGESENPANTLKKFWFVWACATSQARIYMHSTYRQYLQILPYFSWYCQKWFKESYIQYCSSQQQEQEYFAKTSKLTPIFPNKLFINKTVFYVDFHDFSEILLVMWLISAWL